jgi:uncharacterized protein YeeX (DUF496 family)|tara:strand:+ start:1935 stop:2282 length:348 start_codon:yes stop_codon:yes gene_type:complete
VPKDKEYNYGQELKDIRFRVTDDDHARLLIRLRHNKIPMSMLFRAVIDGVIEEDPNITAFIDDYVFKHKILSRGRFSKSAKLKKKGQEILEDFGFLDEADKENLFDLIAQEFPDL